jgi:ribosomal protein S18 acetylase RimI-like enzyme
LKIREATLGDLDSIISIDTQGSGMAKPEYWQETFDLYAGLKENRFFLVAESDDQIAGFILGEIRAWEFGSAPCGWVFAIGVNQDTRFHGVGTKMLDAISDHFQKAGITKIRTMVARQNHEIHSFFRSQGMMAGPYQQLEKDLP